MLKYHFTPSNLIPKTTALWAFSESGLGGIFHALKVPFSGIALGGISVILVTFLAYKSNQKWKTIVQAMLLVLMLKAMISPHSPVMAYVAVSFQGLLGAAIYQVFGVNKVSAMAFGSIALFESAFQKVFTLTIIFGMQLWDAFYTFFDALTVKFGSDFLSDLPVIILTAYGLLYAIAGIFAGIFAVKLPQNIDRTAKELGELKRDDFQISKRSLKKRNRYKRLLIFISILIFILSVLLYAGQDDKVWYTLLRTIVVILLFLFVFNPVAKFLINLWVKKRKSENQQRLDQLMDFLPQIKKNASLAYQFSLSHKNIFSRIRNFLWVWLTLSLYFEEE
ncbi:hypothetical protein G3O08_13850 [Cryomorpha ignava]|uniref:Uncharacterized protein n=1 Tax=Cryomorpha ignava TaxID=101383 RepID=A0A7K3WSC4_9FLAO|nr:hypothetical protein [Cryomorpha ignava]NEN24587.1 hypothetical protein [Cryomorpha ignava]